MLNKQYFGTHVVRSRSSFRGGVKTILSEAFVNLVVSPYIAFKLNVSSYIGDNQFNLYSVMLGATPQAPFLA